MDDILTYMKDAGVPAGFMAAGAAALYVADKLHLWERPNRKSEREILSMDEREFRVALMTRVGDLEERCETASHDLAACEEKHSRTMTWLIGVIEDLRRAGLTNFPPMPADLELLARRVNEAIKPT